MTRPGLLLLLGLWLGLLVSSWLVATATFRTVDRVLAEARPELAGRLAAVPLAHEWTADRAREWWDRHRPAGDKVWRVLEEAVR